MPKPILVSLDINADPPVTVDAPDYVVKKRRCRRIVWKRDPDSPHSFRFRYLKIDGGGSMFVSPTVKKKSIEIIDRAQFTVTESVYWYTLTVEHKGVIYTSGLASGPGPATPGKKKGKGEVILGSRPVIRNR